MIAPVPGNPVPGNPVPGDPVPAGTRTGARSRTASNGSARLPPQNLDQ